MNTVYFTDEGHKYTSENGDYQSVSGLWKPYKSVFNPLEVSTKKAMKEYDEVLYTNTKKDLSYDHPDFINRFYESVPEEGKVLIKTNAKNYRLEWEAKTQKGTDFHKKMEDIDYENGYSINPFDGEKYDLIIWDKNPDYENESFPGDLMDIPDGYVAEHLVKSDHFGVAGQIDKNYIETINGVRYIDIDDYKTDKVIELKPGFFNRKKGGFAKLKFPFDHIYETNFWLYAVKISTYAKMLELQGFVVRNLAFTHIIPDENLDILLQTQYKLPYKDFEAALALKMHLNKKVA